MPTRRLALLAVLAFAVLPSSALAQSAGDDQYTNPVPQVQSPSNSGTTSGSTGSGSGSGSGSSSGAGTSAGTTSSTDTNTSTTTSDSTGSSSGSDNSGKTLPRTGLPLGVLAALGLLFTFSGRGLRRASEEPAPDPYAEREPDVPARSPVARARRRSD
jgi:hypothetical protein